MKNSLLVPVVYIANLLSWVCILALLAQLGSYESIHALIDRNFIVFFSNIVYQALYLIPLAAMLSLLNIYFFLIRHKSILFITLPLLIILSAFSVLILIPYSYHFLDLYTGYNKAMNDELKTDRMKVFEGGYIRDDSEVSRVIWYTVSGNQEEVSPVVVVNNQTMLGLPAMKIYPMATYSNRNGTLASGSTQIVKNAGGQDPLLINSMKLPFFLDRFTADVQTILELLQTSNKRDFLSYIWFAGSFFIAINSLWVFGYATGWRLLNVLLLLTTFCMLFFCFPYTKDGPVFSAVFNFLPESIDSNLISPLLYICFSTAVLIISFLVWIKRKFSHSGQETSYA